MWKIEQIRRYNRHDNSYQIFYMKQNLTEDKISLLELEKMPGFRITWYYNQQQQLSSKYQNSSRTVEFVR